MSIILQLRNISKIYKSNAQELVILDRTNFTLRRAEMVALVAPSGSGKSTFLHIAGLLEQASSGKIYIYNQEIEHTDNALRTKIRGAEIGFVYQAHHLLPEFSALENVMMPLLLSGKSQHIALSRATKLLTYLKLADKAQNRPGELSGGQQQRVAIARAVANAPSILLADEPTGNLDPATSKNVFNILLSLVRQVGISAIIATHNYELAKRMDRIITIQNGKIVELT